MATQLEALLALRRDAENVAKSALDVAASACARANEEQTRLIACWQEATHALDRESRRWLEAPATALQAVTREQYRRRLDDEVAGTARRGQEHRSRVIAAAVAAENEARAAYTEAQRAREVAENVKERADAEEAKRADRRAEDAAADQALATFMRRPGQV